MFPESVVSTIVRAVTRSRTSPRRSASSALGLLLWSSLGLFGALESAFNIVYGRPNRPFFRGKALAAGLMVGLLVVLFAGLVVALLRAEPALEACPDVAGNSVTAYSSRLWRRLPPRSPSSLSRTTC